MTEAQLAQLHHELSKLERELVAVTDQALALVKENELLREELRAVTKTRDALASGIVERWLKQNDEEDGNV